MRATGDPLGLEALILGSAYKKTGRLYKRVRCVLIPALASQDAAECKVPTAGLAFDFQSDARRSESGKGRYSIGPSRLETRQRSVRRHATRCAERHLWTTLALATMTSERTYRNALGLKDTVSPSVQTAESRPHASAIG